MLRFFGRQVLGHKDVGHAGRGDRAAEEVEREPFVSGLTPLSLPGHCDRNTHKATALTFDQLFELRVGHIAACLEYRRVKSPYRINRSTTLTLTSIAIDVGDDTFERLRFRFGGL